MRQGLALRRPVNLGLCLATAVRMDADSVICKWQGAKASGRSISQSFLLDLCELQGVDKLHPSPVQD